MTRRHFMQLMTTSAATVALQGALGQTDVKRSLRLGFDSYSIRGLKWNTTQMLDYAASLKLDMVQSSHGDFESFEEPYLKKLKEHADRLGVYLEAGFACICPLSKGFNKKQLPPTQYLLDCIRITKTLGATCFKVFMGNSSDRDGSVPIEQLMESTIHVLKTVRSQAMDAGVKIALENHGDLLAREARTVIEQAGKEFVGCCLDSGNPTMLLEDPFLTLEVLAPYVVTSHLRDTLLFEHPRGVAVQWVTLGNGVIDLERFTRRFSELCPKAPFQLEIIAGRTPRVLPCFEADFWKPFPTMPASDFARFLALPRKPLPAEQPTAAASAAESGQRQRVDLESSLAYAKNKLGVGLKWQR